VTTSGEPARRRVVVLAPMPLELQAIVAAFGLSPTADDDLAPWTGRVGGSDVTAIHIGMGPPRTRAATARVFDPTASGRAPVDHVMIAGVCGGLDPDLAVGTLINPEIVIDNTSGATFRHRPPHDHVPSGKLVTTENVSLDPDQSRRFFEAGCIGVDMESAAVAEVCEAQDCAWSVYRCISDRHFDGLLDERIIAATNPDGSGNRVEIERLLAAEPDLAVKLGQLTRDVSMAARLSAEAAVRGCLALDG
jgi:adenosylhomocysteine nucleosidase